MRFRESATIAPFVLVRFSGYAATGPHRLRADRAVAGLDEVRECRLQLAALTDPLSDALYELVPTLPAEERRAAVGLRRDVHNGRVPRISEEARNRITARLAPDMRLTLARWLAVLERSEAAMTAYTEIFETELAEAEAELIEQAGTDEMIKALSLAAPEVTAAVLRGDPDRTAAKARRKLVRTLFNYFVRATVKTSPLGWFSPVAVCSIGGEGPEGSAEGGSYQAVASLPQALYLRLLQRFCAHESAGRHLRFHPVRRLNGTHMVRAGYLHTRTNSFFWREDLLTDLTAHREQARTVPHGMSGDQVLAALHRDDSEASWSRVARLTDSGLLRLESAWAPGVYDAHHAMTALAESPGVTDAMGTEVAGALRDLGEGMRRMSEAAPRSRAALASRITRRAAELDEATATATAPRVPDLAVREDVVRNEPLPALPAWVENALSGYGRRLSSRMSVLPQYASTLEFWRRHIAPGHDCLPLPAFLSRYMTTPGPHLRHNADVRLPGTPDLGIGMGPSMLRPAFAILFQLATLEDQEQVIVLNQIMDGSGGVTARFRGLLAPRFLEDPLRRWLDHLVPEGSRPLELPVSSDWNPVQARCAGRTRALDIGGGLVPAGEPVPLDRLRIRLDERSGTLVVEDEHGPVVPFYSGLVPRRMLNGPANLLSTIASPWYCAAPEVWGTASLLLRLERPAGVVHTPRARVGAVVTRRAHWTVSAAELLAEVRAPTPALTFAAYRDWARAHGVADELFVRRGTTEPDLFAKSRKPLWLSGDVPLSVSGLLDSLSAKEILIMEEALPRPGADSPVIDGHPRTAEYVAHLSWDGC
ncbi:lantibiotic dehydratase [Spongiactinospora sp. 9N601]|uniref:lantibiotic dehydratase n=1 Tax=Spongiactinospora sp. 9N601 TaxID=3375149 RepID=UPI0037B13076